MPSARGQPRLDRVRRLTALTDPVRGSAFAPQKTNYILDIESVCLHPSARHRNGNCALAQQDQVTRFS